MASGDRRMVLRRDGQQFDVVFKWGTSRAGGTSGQNICTAYVDGRKVDSCMGGGYDMEGVALAPWLETHVRATDAFYGLQWRGEDGKPPYTDKRDELHMIPVIDGACGLDSILRNLGFSVGR